MHTKHLANYSSVNMNPVPPWLQADPGNSDGEKLSVRISTLSLAVVRVPCMVRQNYYRPGADGPFLFSFL